MWSRFQTGVASSTGDMEFSQAMSKMPSEPKKQVAYTGSQSIIGMVLVLFLFSDVKKCFWHLNSEKKTETMLAAVNPCVTGPLVGKESGTVNQGAR